MLRIIPRWDHDSTLETLFQIGITTDWMIPLRVSRTQLKPGHDEKLEEIVKKVLFAKTPKNQKYKLCISLIEDEEDDDGGSNSNKKKGAHAAKLIIRNPNDGSEIHGVRVST